MQNPSLSLARAAIDQPLFADETRLTHALATSVNFSAAQKLEVSQRAARLVEAIRAEGRDQGSLDAFLLEYSLSTEEGVVLMCLAEALLRIPDAATADKLIADKLGGADWQSHLGKSDSWLVNASSWGLMLTGKFLGLGRDVETDVSGFLGRLVKRTGEPVLRNAMRQAMRIMGQQFVMGQTMPDALSRASQAPSLYYSFDMLGESAATAEDAVQYFKSYSGAMAALAGTRPGADVFQNLSLSVKLSALHARYEEKTRASAFPVLLDRLKQLALQAKAANLGLTIDAEEVARLEFSLDLFEAMARDKDLAGWNGLGLAVQAYGKRALPVLEWLAQLARDTNRKIPVRLVKGAYWDSEVKRAQEQGLEDYPVFTRKAATDASYQACAKFMLNSRDALYPQFATHNAQTLAAILAMGDDFKGYEFQRLHGMGEALYKALRSEIPSMPVRVYAPVGPHKDLLAYLVRRLLENGANSSFVNRLADEKVAVAEITKDPLALVLALQDVSSPNLAKPADVFAPRKNSKGLTFWRNSTREMILGEINKELKLPLEARPIIDGVELDEGPTREIFSPHDSALRLAKVYETSDAAASKAMDSAAATQEAWSNRPAADRATILERAADIFERHQPQLIALLIREAGKTLDNAHGDLREAVDFLRYYASEARRHFANPVQLPGPTGEHNEMTFAGRGVFVCISPWNFPLAIFTGQVSAALAAGNAVIAKPAEQTPLIAYAAVKLLHEAGVPKSILQFVPGDGARLGAILLRHKALSGVAFTGSNETARIINQTLAAREGAIPVLIAETGGINAMIVDSSALPEQVVRDVLSSAFDSAGQRCSALRLLFLQDDIADRVIHMLKGAMQELTLGDPLDYATDIGPVIDLESQEKLEAAKAALKQNSKLIFECTLPKACDAGTFVAPAAYEITLASLPKREIFGPVLHVIRFGSGDLETICQSINDLGYGLTLGLHTRIESTSDFIRARMRVGNLYVNRNQIGAVVGAQPFGGEAQSGTGPKAGGPHYLPRFAVERVYSVDVTARGGNAALLSQVD
jgi:RHH-type proline utilization regulon transcriptional repressor/proline dehydrogenase/delta 1-pyrroline-5-carboxylate dehydrogenase